MPPDPVWCAALIGLLVAVLFVAVWVSASSRPDPKFLFLTDLIAKIRGRRPHSRSQQ